jgi:uncharacterized protein
MKRNTPRPDRNRISSRLLDAVVLLSAFMAVGFISDAYPASSDGLKIMVYGATGRVGSRVVNEALQRDHNVTAVSRDPGQIKQQHAGLSTAKGDILDRESVAELISKQDVVVVSVRGSVGGSKAPEDTVHRMAADILVGVLRNMGDSAPRLIYVGGAGSLEVEPGVLYADNLPRFMPRFIRQEIEGHLLTLEFLRTADDVKWTYISPARKFKPGKRTGVYRIGGDQMLLDKKGKSKISMEDFAVALIDEAENPAHIGKRFSVAY